VSNKQHSAAVRALHASALRSPDAFDYKLMAQSLFWVEVASRIIVPDEKEDSR
jgi:hypothetical protein